VRLMLCVRCSSEKIWGWIAVFLTGGSCLPYPYAGGMCCCFSNQFKTTRDEGVVEGRRVIALFCWGGKVRLSGEIWAEDSTVWLVGDSVGILHAKQQKKGQ
jgi:hypothetical protein